MTRKVIALTIALAAGLVLQACGHDGGGRRDGGPRGGAVMFGGPGGGPGGAQAPARELQLRRFDANADGTIPREEFDKVVNADLAVCDKDGNGELSPSETRGCNERLLADRNTSPIIDWNADGHVALDEFAAQWRTLFENADADRDGTVTSDELTKPTGGPRERGKPGGPGGRGGGPAGRGGGPGGPGGDRPRGGN